MSTESPQAAWERSTAIVANLRQEIAKSIVGQETVVELMLVALICRGHCLLIGVPGLAKTMLVSTLGQSLGLDFRRIQFTPDMMPSDILGSDILQVTDTGERRFVFQKGPVFSNLILADEVNRTPPKTQAALLEAMQERQVTAGGSSMDLPSPFVVYATQNPIEHEGTYPLPEAQLDRFFFSIVVDYPSMDEERDILTLTTGRQSTAPTQVANRDEVLALQDAVIDVPVPDHVTDYILRLVHASRPASDLADDYIRRHVAWGAGPRASQTLVRAAKAMAMLRGMPAASEEEVRAVASPVLRHRIVPSYNATGEGIQAQDIIDHLLQKIG